MGKKKGTSSNSTASSDQSSSAASKKQQSNNKKIDATAVDLLEIEEEKQQVVENQGNDNASK